MRKLRELRKAAAGGGKALQPAEILPRSISKATCCGRVLLGDVADSGQELTASAGREANDHLRARARILSASASTFSSEDPRPEAISRSPRASSRKICRSRSLRSKASTPSKTACARPRSVTIKGCLEPRTRRTTRPGFSPSSATETARELLVTLPLLSGQRLGYSASGSEQTCALPPSVPHAVQRLGDELRPDLRSKPVASCRAEDAPDGSRGASVRDASSIAVLDRNPVDAPRTNRGEKPENLGQ